MAHEGIEFANGVLLSDDVSLANCQRFQRLEMPEENGASGVDGMTIDTQGHPCVTSRIGLRIRDQPAGRGHLEQGSPRKSLYVTVGGRVCKREIQRKGVSIPWGRSKPDAQVISASECVTQT